VIQLLLRIVVVSVLASVVLNVALYWEAAPEPDLVNIPAAIMAAV
jgi:hypothetical protein